MFGICLLYRDALIINPCLARRLTNPCCKNNVKPPPVLIQSFPRRAPFPSTQLALALASSRLVLSVFKSALCSSKGAFVALALLSEAPPPAPPPSVPDPGCFVPRQRADAAQRPSPETPADHSPQGVNQRKARIAAVHVAATTDLWKGNPVVNPGGGAGEHGRSSNPEGEALRALPSLNTDNRVFT